MRSFCKNAVGKRCLSENHVEFERELQQHNSTLKFVIDCPVDVAGLLENGLAIGLIVNPGPA